MAKFIPLVDAVQWLGTNITEIRQFIRAAGPPPYSAVIRDGILYVQEGLTPGLIPIAVPVNNWVIITAETVTVLDDLTFLARYRPNLP